MAAKGDPTRAIVLSLLGAALFTAGLHYYLTQAMKPPAPPVLVPGVASSAEAADSTPELTAANALVQRFASALAEGRHDAAYALMAAPYRQSVSLAAFEARCASSPFLAGARRATVVSTRATHIAGAGAGPYSMLGRGVLEGSAGSIDASFTFLVDGGRPSILVLALGGVPLLDGISGAVPPPGDR